MQRVNYRFFFSVLACFLGATVGVYFLHGWQIERNAEGHARRADEYEADGKPDEAIGELEHYFIYRPHDKKRIRQYALLLHARARSKGAPSYQVREAINALDKALRGAPDDDELCEMFAEFAVAAGESSTAYELLKPLRRQLGVKGLPMADPAEDRHAVKLDIMYAKACINIRLDDEAMDVLGTMTGYIPVIRAFDPTIQPAPGRAEAFLLLAGLLDRQFKDRDSATGVMHRLEEVADADPVAWRYLSWWWDTHGDLEAAEVAIEKSVALSPRDPESLYQEFCVAMRRRRLDRAEAIINGLLVDLADSPAFTIARADLALAKGDTDAMIGFLRDGVERFPDETRVLTKYVFSLADLKLFEELEQAVTRARELMGRNCVPALYADAVVAMDEHRWVKSLGLWLKLRPLMVGDAAYTRMVDLRLAACHDALGESARASGSSTRTRT